MSSIGAQNNNKKKNVDASKKGLHGGAMPPAELAVALDVSSRRECLEWVESFAGLDLVIKLGLGVLPHLEIKDYLFIRDRGFKIFIDAKLHDIPSQVALAVRTWADLGADYLTLHVSGGRRMMEEASQVASALPRTSPLRLLGVTVLTSLGSSSPDTLSTSVGPSLGSQDLREVGFERDVLSQVVHLGQLARSCGISSFVCSVGEVKALRDSCGQDSFCVTPGLVLGADGGVSASAGPSANASASASASESASPNANAGASASARTSSYTNASSNRSSSSTSPGTWKSQSGVSETLSATTSSQSDQSRVHTVDEAIQAQVNLLVMGRSILKSPHPRDTAEEILKRLSQNTSGLA